jgi:hypothetical protein
MKCCGNSLIMKKFYVVFTVLLSIVSIHANTINIGCPTAGTGGSITICETNSSTIFLADLIEGENLGGIWVRMKGSGGVFNATFGWFTPAIGTTTSIFRYRIIGVAPCVDDLSFATINISQQPNAGLDGSTSICESSTVPINLFGLLTGEQTGGTWTRTSGTSGLFNAALGTFTPSQGSTTSTFQYTILGSAPCPNDTSIASVIINQQPNAGITGSTTICDNSILTIGLIFYLTGEQAGGTWTRLSGSGGIFNAIAGTYTPAPGATSSVFEYRIAGVPPCVDDFSIVPVNIYQQPDAGIDGCISVSDETPFIIDLYSLITGEQVGGTWTRTSGSGGTFDSLSATYVPAVGATTSTFEYSIIGTPPCADDNSVATIVINGPPCGTLSSVNFQGDTIEYFPNPISDVLNLKFPQTIKNIQILNVLGQKVFSSDYNDKVFQIDLSNLSSGPYIVKAMVANTIRTFKILKN